MIAIDRPTLIVVIPAKAGTQLLTLSYVAKLDARLRGTDGHEGKLFMEDNPS
jgi:hypothetical protein